MYTRKHRTKNRRTRRRGGEDPNRAARVAAMGYTPKASSQVEDATLRVTGEVSDTPSPQSLFKKRHFGYDPFKAEDATKRTLMTNAGRTEAKIKAELKPLEEKLAEFQSARYHKEEQNRDYQNFGVDFNSARNANLDAILAEAKRDEPGIKKQVESLKEELAVFQTNVAGGRRKKTRKSKKSKRSTRRRA